MTDLYELTMAQVYFDKGMNEEAVFDFYIRPSSKRAYFIMGGVAELIENIENFRFSRETLVYLDSLDLFSSEFLDYLANFRFCGEVWAVDDGEIVFANEPLVVVKASLVEAQIIETLLINTLQYPIMAATKAARCVSVARDTKLVDFGARRAHGIDSSLKAAKYSYMTGFLGTSNLLAGKMYGINVFGTMAHSFILAHNSEEEAFKDFIHTYPDNAILLVDTFDTLEGVKKAIEVVKKLGLKSFKGIRIDSGDIEILAREARKILDSAGFEDAIILVSGGVDEYMIDEFLTKGAPIDAWGVGTKLTTCDDMPSLDCAYKLAAYANQPKMKWSPHKITLPGLKQVFRKEYDDIVDCAKSEHPGHKKLLKKVMDKGKRCIEEKNLEAMQKECLQRIVALPSHIKGIHTVSPHLPKIGKCLQKMIERLKIK